MILFFFIYFTLKKLLLYIYILIMSVQNNNNIQIQDNMTQVNQFNLWKIDNADYIKQYINELKKTHKIIKKNPKHAEHVKKYSKTEKGRLSRNKSMRNYYKKKKLEKKLKLEKELKLQKELEME